MRFLILAIIVGFSVPAAASPVSDVCGQLVGNQVSQCMAAANGKWIDAAAAKVCGALVGMQVTSCIGAIAGKDYSSDEAKTCGALVGTQITDCLGRAGHAHVDRQGRGHQIQGHASEHVPYCGGAYPSREMLQQLEAPKSLALKRFQVRPGDRNSATRPVAEFVTLSDATFVVSLASGTFCVVEAERPAADAPIPADASMPEQCREERRHCDAVWSVGDSDQTGVEIRIERNCFWRKPCQRPMPPPP